MKNTQSESKFTLYPRIVGSAWSDLAAPVQQFHVAASPLHCSGLFTVRRGSSVPARLFAWLMRLPAAGDKVPVQLVVDANAEGEQWNRTFAGRPFITQQGENADGFMTERIGLMEIWYRLLVADRALYYEQASASLRIGALRIPLPRWLAPKIAAREWDATDEKGVNVSVSVTAPLVGLLINYQGYIECED